MTKQFLNKPNPFRARRLLLRCLRISYLLNLFSTFSLQRRSSRKPLNSDFPDHRNSFNILMVGHPRNLQVNPEELRRTSEKHPRQKMKLDWIRKVIKAIGKNGKLPLYKCQDAIKPRGGAREKSHSVNIPHRIINRSCELESKVELN